jgi:hypothetical protein
MAVATTERKRRERSGGPINDVVSPECHVLPLTTSEVDIVREVESFAIKRQGASYEMRFSKVAIQSL